MKRGIDTLIPVLGDQLSPGLSALRDADPTRSVILMMEVAEEATYVRHHKKKIAFLFAAMRHHARALEQAGWRVNYVRLDDPDNSGSLTGELARAIGLGHGGARAVGQALRRNPLPILVPCHRVVSTAGDGGYAGATDGPLLRIKRALLKQEHGARGDPGRGR